MSFINIYDEENPATCTHISDRKQMAEALKPIGVRFEQWSASHDLSKDATQEEILKAYEKPVARLMHDCGFVTADVISVHSEMPNHPDLRKKFLDEHKHSEDEARFFVDGCGLFYIHANQRVYAVLCERGDFINIPAGTRHWFDMGPRPMLKCIRTFTTPEGWVAEFTGSDIASRFPRFEILLQPV
jgi:1,2-dihydroxy-3-keto-5-methylthiopentene dioxygenase